jgi:hypothetical protein
MQAHEGAPELVNWPAVIGNIDMPLNETDKAWIRQEIQAAHRRHGLGKLTGFIRDWSGAGGCIAILIFFLTQWSAYIVFRTNTQDRLAEIEKTLAPVALQNHASLPQSQFETVLPDLKSAITAARERKVKVSPKVLDDLQSKLLTSSANAPAFWPTVAEFIDYRSFNQSSWASQANLPSCTSSLPKSGTVANVETPTKMSVNRAIYENCRFTLDSAEDDRILNTILNTVSPLITFKHCLILYRGGVVDLILTWQNHKGELSINGKPRGTIVSVSGNAIEFEDCLFDFTFQNAPSPVGQEIAETLLSQNASTLKIP